MTAFVRSINGVRFAFFLLHVYASPYWLCFPRCLSLAGASRLPFLGLSIASGMLVRIKEPICAEFYCILYTET